MRWPVALAFLLPALVVYGGLFLTPMLRGLWLSLTDFRGVGQANFIGTANYSRMFADPIVGLGLRNTLLYSVIVVVAQNALGLAFAALLAALPAVRNSLRVALLTPSMSAMIIIGFIWSYIYSPVGGTLNALLDAMGLGNLQQVWLGDPAFALGAVAVVHIWMYAGYSAAIFLVGYLNISSEILDAADLDGASGWRKFKSIQWPLLASATTINVTLSAIGTLKVFDLPLTMTQGGPNNATNTLSLLIYQFGFSQNQFAYASAIAMMMLVVIVVISTFLTRVLRAREFQA